LRETSIRSVVTTLAIPVLLAVLTFLAAIAFWMDRSVGREAAFLDHATEVLAIDTSQEALAARLMDEAIDAVPLLALVRGAGERATVGLLDSGAFDPAIDSVVIAGHRYIITQPDGPLAVDLTEVREVIVAPIARFAPDLADRVPVDVFESVVILEPDALPLAVRFLPWASAASIFLAAAAAFAAIAYVMLAERRSVALGSVGLALLGAGLGVVVWSIAGGPLAATSVDDALSRILVRNAYDVFSRSLRTEGVWLVVAGVAIAAAALVGYSVEGGVARSSEEGLRR
jgi:hypothetical protein